MHFRKDQVHQLTHEMRIEDHLQDRHEPERIKQITAITIDMPNVGCTCWCKSFMVFTSDKEIDCANSKVLKAFAGINSTQKFLDLSLPIAKWSVLDQSNKTNPVMTTTDGNSLKSMEQKIN